MSVEPQFFKIAICRLYFRERKHVSVMGLILQLFFMHLLCFLSSYHSAC